jgi:2-polyprenyl-3-methyl-5-hydroxy-6-metoxy-1,4-benzoquinol methylase
VRYWAPDDGREYEAVARHTANKVFTIDATRPTTALRLATRLMGPLARWRDRAFATSHPAIVVSEQVLENALVLQQIGPADCRILDFGAFESSLPLTLASLGKQVTALDQREYPFSAPGLTVLCRDVMVSMPDLASAFDVVYSISTIEHVGLGDYGDPTLSDGDRLALANLLQLVRPGGRLLMSVPAGRATDHRGYRVYDRERLMRILPAEPSVLRFFAKIGRHETWAEVSAEQIKDLEYSHPYAERPGQGVAFAVVERA